MRKIVRKKVIIQGQGIQDVIIEHGKNGIQYLRRQTVNGVKRLVPYAFDALTNYGNKGIDRIADKFNGSPIANRHNVGPTVSGLMKIGNASIMHGLSDIVQGSLVAKMGGGIKPNRHLMMKEINHALRH